MTLDTALERLRRRATPGPGRPRMELSKSAKAEWQRCWESQHPESYWGSRRQSIIDDILEFLPTNEGILGESSVSMLEGRLYAHVNGWGRRDESWFICDGILPTECDCIRLLLRADDHETCEISAAEYLICVTLATVLHLRGVAEPVALANRTRQRYCLVAWLDAFRTAEPNSDDAWDDFVDQVQFEAEFPTNGPSGEWLALLRDAGYSWSWIMECAEARGYAGTYGALRARRDRFRHGTRRKIQKAHASRGK